MHQFLKRSRSISLLPFEGTFFWVVDLAHIDKDEIREAKNFLDERTLEHSLRFKFEKDQYRSIITHSVLRHHLSEFLGKKPHEIEMLRSETGKPYTIGPIHFNLSHTKDYAFLACHDSSPIGVDIECIKYEDELLKIADQFLMPKEKEHVESSTDPINWFFSYWCAKEALLKAQGTGFLIDQMPIFDEVKQLSETRLLFTCENEEVYVYDGIVKGHKLAVCLSKHKKLSG